MGEKNLKCGVNFFERGKVLFFRGILRKMGAGRGVFVVRVWSNGWLVRFADRRFWSVDFYADFGSIFFGG
jgi:hypothetical protein